MPPAKRASSSSSRSPSSKAAATRAAASSGAKGTGTSARKATGRATTQVKAGTAKSTRSTARSAASGIRKDSGGESLASVAEQLVRGAVKPSDLVMLTRDRIQETLDDAASRGRVTRKDANDLVAELVRRGRSQSEELMGEIQGLLGRVETATKRARSSEPVDRIVRGADRARRAAGVRPSFPIVGYDDLNVGQVQTRLKELSRSDLRKVLTYERKHANRKTVVGALEKSLA